MLSTRDPSPRRTVAVASPGFECFPVRFFQRSHRATIPVFQESASAGCFFFTPFEKALRTCQANQRHLEERERVAHLNRAKARCLQMSLASDLIVASCFICPSWDMRGRRSLWNVLNVDYFEHAGFSKYMSLTTNSGLWVGTCEVGLLAKESKKSSRLPSSVPTTEGLSVKFLQLCFVRTSRSFGSSLSTLSIRHGRLICEFLKGERLVNVMPFCIEHQAWKEVSGVSYDQQSAF